MNPWTRFRHINEMYASHVERILREKESDVNAEKGTSKRDIVSILGESLPGVCVLSR